MTKSIDLVDSRVLSVGVEPDKITIVGVAMDAHRVEYPVNNLVIKWDDLPVQVRNTGDNFLKHLSREFNKLVAGEDSETW